MAGPRTQLPPHPCQECGRAMRSRAELDAEWYTGICDLCSGREPRVEAVELVDGARVWSMPPAAGSGTRLRSIAVGYPDCAGCRGKGCPSCADRRNSHPVRQWIKAREERILAAVQVVYERALAKEGLLDLAKANRCPPKKLEKAVRAAAARFERVKARWSALAASRLRPVSMSR